jgi:hypothetical protein
VAWLFDYSISGTNDSETQPLDDSETQAPEGLHDEQLEDELATQVLRENQIRMIGKYIFL